MSGVVLLACEPIPWMIYAWTGPSLSTLLLFKTLAILIFVVAIKSVLFTFFLGKGIVRGLLAMVVANAVSTVPGVLQSLMFAAPVMYVTGLLLLFASAYVVGSFFGSLQGPGGKAITTSGTGFALLTVLAAIVSSFLAMCAASYSWGGSSMPFWVMKTGALFVALLFGIAMTTGWESLVAARFFAGDDRLAVANAALKANLWTFFGIFFVGAIIALPIRMRRTDFLWLGR
jgi:hypothetical protein